MCNTICTCIYNIQKYKTQISTYAIFVRSHFLVQAIYHNKIHCIIQTQKSEKGTETTSHTPEKQQRKLKKLNYTSMGKYRTIFYTYSNFKFNPFQWKKYYVWFSYYMCVYIWNYFHTILGFLAYINCCYIPCVGWNFPVKYTPEFLKN